MFYVCHCFPMTKLIHSPATHVSRNLHARVTVAKTKKKKRLCRELQGIITIMKIMHSYGYPKDVSHG